MIFYKSYIFIFSLALSFFFFLLNFYYYFSIRGNFSFSFDEKIISFFSRINLDKISFIFIIIVCFVTRLVFLYSEVYIETYKNKKFFFLTLSFFLFIGILSLRGRFINLIIGWDGLGVSSLLLIMFYPNKITLFNSFLTFFFNRLGDIFFIIFFCYCLRYYRIFFHLNNFFSYYLLFIFFLGLITKRAQIPFSSWLPAAISAPTPISAMVHSSTLVTAGIFVFFKFSYLFFNLGIIDYLVYLSIFTFLLGGFLGIIEKDLKKIVAFSTIRQIRIVLLFISFNLFSLSFLHTLGHAFFKTLLFCACGSIFLWKYRDQISFNLRRRKNFLSFSFFFLVRIYSIRGVIFSSSFYTKDLVLEILLESKEFFLFLFLILGRIFTVLYSVKIFDSLSFNFYKNSFSSIKIFHFFFLLFFSWILIFFLKFFLEISFIRNFCNISSINVFLLNFLILSYFFFSFKISKNLLYFSSEILFLKNFSFGFNRKLINEFKLKVINSDFFFFKPRNFRLVNLRFNMNTSKFWIFPLIFILLLQLYSFSLIMNMVLKQPKFKDNF